MPTDLTVQTGIAALLAGIAIVVLLIVLNLPKQKPAPKPHKPPFRPGDVLIDVKRLDDGTEWNNLTNRPYKSDE